MAAREIMDSIGVGQKYCNEIIGKVFKIGNNLGLPGNAIERTPSRASRKTSSTNTGVKVKFPLNKPGCEILLVTPSADFFAEPHIDGLIGYAKVFSRGGRQLDPQLEGVRGGELRMFIGPTRTCGASPYASAKRRSELASSGSSSVSAATPGASPTAS